MRNNHGSGIIGPYKYGRIAKNGPGVCHVVATTTIRIIHFEAAIDGEAGKGAFDITRIGLNQKIHHLILTLHRRVPALVNGRTEESDSSCRFSIVRGT